MRRLIAHDRSITRRAVWPASINPRRKAAKGRASPSVPCVATTKFNPIPFLSVEPQIGKVDLRPEWLGQFDWVITGGEAERATARLIRTGRG
jgi:hypothetical protein